MSALVNLPPVSPGLTSRPSLSAGGNQFAPGQRQRVAGINLPAFVERSSAAGRPSRMLVSPGLTSRPSLSDRGRLQFRQPRSRVAGINLPAFVERICLLLCKRFFVKGVAGINLPAFVERVYDDSLLKRDPGGVAGINLPAFVERLLCSYGRRLLGRVSPGLTSRPSLSGCR